MAFFALPIISDVTASAKTDLLAIATPPMALLKFRKGSESDISVRCGRGLLMALARRNEP